MLRCALAGLVLLLGAAPIAHAQSDSAVALGFAVSVYNTTDSRADNPVGAGLVGRLRRGSGFGPAVGLDWFDSRLRTDVGGQSAHLGTVRIRPVMIGVSYMKQYARFAVGSSFVAGTAFNSLRGSAEARAAYRDRLGAPEVRFRATRCLAWRQDVSIWYELGNHVGLLTSLSYIGARPAIITTGRFGRRKETINVGAPMLTLGIVYGVF